MANETYWEITFLDVDNTEKVERFEIEDDFTNRVLELYTDINLDILNTTSGSNA
jgi:hypothetical protein